MRSAQKKSKRKLQILILSVFAIVVIIGGYFVLRYPAAVPPFYHNEQTGHSAEVAHRLPGETPQPLALQTPESGGDTAAAESLPVNPPDPAQPPSTGAHGPGLAALMLRSTTQPQSGPTVSTQLHYFMDQVQDNWSTSNSTAKP